MGLVLIAAPAVEPISLADLKARLSIDHDLADSLLTTLIAAARAAVERMTRRPMTTQTLRYTLDRAPPGGLVRLPVAPVQTVSAVRVADATGALIPWPGALQLDLAGEPARLLFAGAVPLPGVPIGGIEIDIVAGYGPTADAVPEPLRQAVAMLAAHWYANRGDAPSGPVPDEVTALTAGFRLLRLAA
ncbi:MAG TPA: head-tail connector protein [Methylomirabilota bacterium]|nr:head-tail connector protein [Methylomirabilota bacterium]